MMGNSTTSMLYFFLIFLALYFAGVGVYQLVKFLKKKLEEGRYGYL